MGRIVLVTASPSEDIHSQRVRSALLKRELPFVELVPSSCPEPARTELFELINKSRKSLQPSSSSSSLLLSSSPLAVSLPRLFVNGSLVGYGAGGGSVKSILRLLREWDKDERYACALEKYEMEVERKDVSASTSASTSAAAGVDAAAHIDTLERICQEHGTFVGGGPRKEDDDDEEDNSSSSNPARDDDTRSTSSHGISFRRSTSKSYEALLGEELLPPCDVPLANGCDGVEQRPTPTTTTFHEMTETLRSILTLSDTVHKGTLYRNCFVGSALVEAVSVSMRLSKDRAIEYCDVLVRHRVIVRVSGQPPAIALRKPFKPCPRGVYRLQCYASPDVLNSYRMHVGPPQQDDNGDDDDDRDDDHGEAPPRPSASVKVPQARLLPQLSPTKVVRRLDSFLTQLEVDSLNSRGKVDYSTLSLHPSYQVFEEAICALQEVDVLHIGDGDERTALAINLYKLMMRYAHCKVGFVASDDDKAHFMENVKFIVGHHTYTFPEWLHDMCACTVPVPRVHLSNGNGAPLRSSLTTSLRSSGGGSGSGSGKDKGRRRRTVSIVDVDWRVRLAVHCDPLFGSRFSLPFRTFSAQFLEAELDAVAQTCVQDRSLVSVDAHRHVLKLSRWFQLEESELGSCGDNGAEALDAVISRLLPYRHDASRLSRVTTTEYVDVPVETANVISFARYSKDSVVGQVTAVGYMLMGRFKPPPIPCNEKLRIATLRSLNLLDTTTNDERINRITNQCQSELQAPVVCVTLVDSTRQWFKSSAWECAMPPVPETPKDISFCGHAVAGSPSEAFVVENATEDDRFADNPFVAGDFGARFYAGIPLSFPSGRGVLVNIGTLCVIDFKPRKLSDADMAKLRHYSQLVKQEILRLDDGSTDLCSRGTASSLDSDDEDEDDYDEEQEGENDDAYDVVESVEGG